MRARQSITFLEALDNHRRTRPPGKATSAADATTDRKGSAVAIRGRSWPVLPALFTARHLNSGKSEKNGADDSTPTPPAHLPKQLIGATTRRLATSATLNTGNTKSTHHVKSATCEQDRARVGLFCHFIPYFQYIAQHKSGQSVAPCGTKGNALENISHPIGPTSLQKAGVPCGRRRRRPRTVTRQ